jgi:hypothetical protein
VSLPARQQRVLDRIERRLVVSDPLLHSWFVMFTRLTRDEDMPRIEEVRARLTRFGGWISRRTAPVRRRVPRLSPRVKAIVFFPVALAAMVGTLIIGASGPAMQRCASTVRYPAAELVVKARQCRLNQLSMVHAPLFGH